MDRQIRALLRLVVAGLIAAITADVWRLVANAIAAGLGS